MTVQKLGDAMMVEMTKTALSWYQLNAMRTAIMSGETPPNWYLALGLTGEAGEVAEIIKKNERHGKSINREHLREELGDVLWYLTVLAEMNGLTLAEIAVENINKLKARYPQGFVKRGNQNAE
jgi:NTP pyrophosphatase (non-canonical NTP hydrolase)